MPWCGSRLTVLAVGPVLQHDRHGAGARAGRRLAGRRRGRPGRRGRARPAGRRLVGAAVAARPRPRRPTGRPLRPARAAGRAGRRAAVWRAGLAVAGYQVGFFLAVRTTGVAVGTVVALGIGAGAHRGGRLGPRARPAGPALGRRDRAGVRRAGRARDGRRVRARRARPASCSPWSPPPAYAAYTRRRQEPFSRRGSAPSRRWPRCSARARCGCCRPSSWRPSAGSAHPAG